MGRKVAVRCRHEKEPECLRERVLWLRQHVGETQVQFSRTMGISRSTVANIESGQQMITHDQLVALDSAHGPLNMNWFYFGEGEPFRERST